MSLWDVLRGWNSAPAPSPAIYPREPRPGGGVGAANARRQPAYRSWALALDTVRGIDNPYRLKFVGDVLGVIQFTNPPAEPDVWIRFNGQSWLRLKPGFEWQQPYTEIEVYVGTAIANGRVELALQQVGLVGSDA